MTVIHQCECAICQQSESHPEQAQHQQMNLFMSRLNEQQRRWYAALEAQNLGHGGTTLMARITGLSVETIRRGRYELENDLADRPVDRVRQAGGGRQTVEKKTPSIATALKEVIDDEIAGDPMADHKWVRRSLKYLAQALVKRRFRIGPTTVRRLLKKLKYRLFGNCQSLTPRHPDRDKQFRFIRRVKKLFLTAGWPVISVDTKKKELIGNVKNAGRIWQQSPTLVNTHDFLSEAVGRATPYGIYDLAHQQGSVYVGTSYDTPEFAAYAIAQWWADPDRPRFAREDKLLILCDAGGSNNCRYWRWKIEVQKQLADTFGIEVMICHYPTGASKWNPIEHRLFSEISKNWAGKPLRTFQTMLNYIRDTTTETGLKVKACLVERVFDKGMKYDPQERDNLNLQRCRTCPTWNYILRPHVCSG